jgi:hypothetical protein
MHGNAIGKQTNYIVTELQKQTWLFLQAQNYIGLYEHIYQKHGLQSLHYGC